MHGQIPSREPIRVFQPYVTFQENCFEQYSTQLLAFHARNAAGRAPRDGGHDQPWSADTCRAISRREYATVAEHGLRAR